MSSLSDERRLPVNPVNSGCCPVHRCHRAHQPTRLHAGLPSIPPSSLSAHPIDQPRPACPSIRPSAFPPAHPFARSSDISLARPPAPCGVHVDLPHLFARPPCRLPGCPHCRSRPTHPPSQSTRRQICRSTRPHNIPLLARQPV